MAIRLSEIVEALELLSDDMEYVYDVVDQNILLVWDGMVDGEYNQIGRASCRERV